MLLVCIKCVNLSILFLILSLLSFMFMLPLLCVLLL